MDIVFTLDTSYSIGPSGLSLLKGILVDLMDEFDIENDVARVSECLMQGSQTQIAPRTK